VTRDPIAIVGIGCRLPGAANVRDFWSLLLEKREAIREVPPDRFNLDALYHPTPATPGRVMSRWGGFLENIDRFDAQFFGVSPREADRLDPQQRLLLEVTAEALDDAGLRGGRDGSRTGVFVGMWLNDYESRLFRDPRAIDFYMTTGSGRYSASGRLSYVFGFEGPSLTIDCACSSSLAAVHLACRSLWSGETDAAIAGGANVILEPHITIAYSQSRMMAPDGHCKFGDAAADGYVRSEGAAVVVLKPLADALAAGDPIYALIRGSAVNNDGKSSGFLATPGRAGQETMLRRAYADAGVDPASVQYIEAHGTGTRAGDPVEIGALGEVLGAGRPAGQACRVGSVKSNIGHTEGAAGVTGLIKVALAMKHGVIPASLHCHEPNPAIPWDRIGIAVQREAGPWRDDVPAVAGVSSFGIAGTNAHVVLEQYHDVAPVPAPDGPDGACLIPLSAQSPSALVELARSWQELLEHESPALPDLAFTAAVRRTHYDYRAPVVAGSRAELAAQLDLLIKGDPSGPSPVRVPDAGRPGKVVFVFPGQGSQWLGMGRELLRREPAFRTAIEACDAAVRLETGWSVLDELEASPAASRLDQIDVIQPVLSSVQIALAALWRSWGFEPSAVVGHSMGEVAAACTAGALSIEDAARVICRRSRLLRRTSGQGVMAVVGLSFDETAAAIAGREARVSIAVSNSPRSTVISGDVAVVDAVIADLEKRDVFCRRVKVDVASHSPQMDPLRDELFAALQDVAPRAGAVAICSTVLAAVTDGAGFDAGYWVRNLRQPVLFSTAVQALIAGGHDTFIEMSPHPLLASSVQELLQDAGVNGIVVGSLRREENEGRALAAAIGAIWAGGGAVDFSRVCRKGHVVALPSYPWQRERHWLDVAAARGAFGQSVPLCGRRLSSPVPGYEAEFAPAADAWVSAADIDGVAVIPQAASVAIGAAVAREFLGTDVCRLERMEFPSVAQPTAETVTLQTIVSPKGQHAASFAVHHLASTAADGRQHWQVIATGEMARDSAGAQRVDPAGLLAPGARPVPAADFYAALAARGVRVRDEGRALEQVWTSPAGCVGKLASASDPGRDVLVLQAALDLIASVEARDQFVWTADSVVEARIGGQLQSAAWCHVGLTVDEGGGATGTAAWYSEDGTLLAQWTTIALRQRHVAEFAGSHRARTADWTYDLTWEPLVTGAGETAMVPPSTVVLLGGTTAADVVAPAARALGWRVVAARAGDRFGREGGGFVIDPANPSHYVQLLHEVEIESGGSPAGFVHMLSLDESRDADAPIEVASRRLASSLIFAAQALAQPGGGRLWVVTRGSQTMAGDQAPAVEQAPCWGAARALALEMPDTFAGILDLDAAADASDLASSIVRLAGGGQGERQVMRRGGVDYVPRLVAAPAVPAAALRLSREASYLVTGGLGRLGLEAAQWLAAKGAGQIVLVGRHGLPPRQAWDDVAPGSEAGARVRAVRNVESLGARVEIVAADTADRTSMGSLFERFGLSLPTLRGVIHAAGRIDYRPLAEITQGEIDDVLRAKLQGTVLLHELTKQAPLDFFVLFSSGASVWGSRDLAHYAAANHLLDAFAAARRAAGLPALAINWGWWAGGSTTEASEALFAQAGLRKMAAFDALQVMGDLIAAGVGQRTVASIDWSVFKPSLESTGSSLLARIDGVPATTAAAAGRGVLAAEIAALGAGEARIRLTQYICGQVGAVLGRDPSQLDTLRGFFKLGMDSLMTVELRRRLEAALDRTLPATIAFEYPTVAALAGYLCTVLGKVESSDAPAPAVAAAAPVAALEALADRSEDELASMLDDELAHLLGEEGRAN
jgi:myxalamid-type polyketide synthase MxaE and MxaD